MVQYFDSEVSRINYRTICSHGYSEEKRRGRGFV